MAKRVIRALQVRARTGLGNTAVHEFERAGLLPQFFKISGGRASGCFEDELDEVLDARAAGATDDDIKAIVHRQVERRKARFAALRAAS